MIIIVLEWSPLRGVSHRSNAIQNGRDHRTKFNMGPYWKYVYDHIFCNFCVNWNKSWLQ